MKYFTILILLICMTVPAYSQDNSQRYRALGDNINRTLTNSNSNLQHYDQMLEDNENLSGYVNFNRRFQAIQRNLIDTENLIDFLVRGNARTATIRAERNRYENLIKQLEALKDEYDEWIRNH